MTGERPRDLRVRPAPGASVDVLLRELCDQSPLMMWISDAHGRPLYCNAAWRACFGAQAAWPASPPQRGPGQVALARDKRSALPPVETIAIDGVDRHFLVARFLIPAQALGTCQGVIAADVTEHKRRAEEMQRLSITDELTGVYNRRGFLMFALHDFEAARRRRARCALVYVDIDNLKRVNDSAGHVAGDLLLREAAGVLRRTFRETDVVGRLGGDEFVVLATDVSDDEEGLRRRLQDRLALLAPGRKDGLSLSLSVGIVNCDWDEPLALDQAMAAADRRLYEDKDRRRTLPARGSGAAA